MKQYISWEDIDHYCYELAKQIKAKSKGYDVIIGVARGGLIPAVILSHLLDISSVMCIGTSSYSKNNIQQKLYNYQNIAPELLFEKRVLIADDLVDSGLTLDTIKNYYKIFADITIDTAVLFKKDCTKFKPDFFVKDVKKETWIVFPYERKR
jgi:hypoxanthine phosphoribosyltransferase